MQAHAVAMASSLFDSFSEFIESANRLESSYRQLQSEVALLRIELEERNRELERSVFEAETVRIALKRILDALPCGVLQIDPHFQRVELANPEAQRLLATDKEGAELQTLPEVVRTVLKRFEQEGESPCECEHQVSIERRDGIRWLSFRRAQSYGDTSRAWSSHPVLIFSDVTAQKEAEAEREKSRNVLALAEMSTVLAHEIRNPLASLELITGLLEESPGSDDVQQWISCLRAGVRQLSATTNNVLTFYTQTSVRFEHVDLCILVRDCAMFALPMADQAGVKVRVDHCEPHIMTFASVDALKQAILNVTCNALKHTPQNGEIRFSVELSQRKAETAVIRISDTGCGIPADELSHIFEAGFSGTGATPGLGLAVSRRILRQHAGEIEIISAPQRGTTVIMELPIR
jgi:signal transduction histidine kinase